MVNQVVRAMDRAHGSGSTKPPPGHAVTLSILWILQMAVLRGISPQRRPNGAAQESDALSPVHSALRDQISSAKAWSRARAEGVFGLHLS